MAQNGRNIQYMWGFNRVVDTRLITLPGTEISAEKCVEGDKFVLL